MGQHRREIEILIVIGPDPLFPGTCWSVASATEGEGELVTDGSPRGPRALGGGHTPGDWLRYAQRKVRVPRGSIRWTDAEVKPYGWSQGAGHAPQGVRIKATALVSWGRR